MGRDARFNARNRLPLDLRDAPMAGRQNGHGLAPAPQLVSLDPVQTAVIILDSILPGRLMPIPIPGGQPMVGQMIDWTTVSGDLAQKFSEKLPTAEEAHFIAVVAAVAAFQQSAIALAQAAAKIRGAPPQDAQDALPEAPDWKPKLVEDEPGFDANGSEVP